MAFFRNSWYCAGWSTDVDEAPVHRKILGEDIVLYRDSGGEIIALGNKCPHRFAPLHQGKVKGDRLECPYHGLQFEAGGACVLNPHGSGQIPSATKVPSYRIEERNGTIWIWMGDHAEADPDQIIDTSFLKDRGQFISRTGCHPVKANYLLVVDNLLDLTHAQFLHPDTVFGKGSSDRWQVSLSGKAKEEEEASQEVWFEEDDRSLTAHYMMRNTPKPPLWDPIVDYDKGDLYSKVVWYPSCNLDLKLTLTPTESEERPASFIAMHFITPIDEMNCYYFFAVGWDVKINDEEAGDRVFDTVKQTVLEEDGPMIEECQANMGNTTDLFSLRPILLQTDGMAIKARRHMEKILKEQARAGSTVQSMPESVAEKVEA